LICEYEFSTPDPRNPKISLVEIDQYGHVPLGSAIHPVEQHRLTLRKNLETGEYEAYRHYHQTKRDEVIFSSKDLGKIVSLIDREVRRVWGDDFAKKDEVCRHDTGECFRRK
jgi:hypothetical protein